MVDELETEVEVEINDENTENSENDLKETEREESGSADESNLEEEFLVKIDGEKQESDEDLAKDPNWLKNLRKENREFKKKQKELEARLAEKDRKQTELIELGPKPTLSDSDVDYDTVKYESKLADWIERKRFLDESKNKQVQEELKQKSIWEQKITSYNEGKTKIPAKDVNDIEDLVKVHLNPIQQGIIVRCAKNPALFVYAIGKNELTLKRLASISDHAEFAYTIGELENKLKTSKRVPETSPEKVVTGSGSKSILSSDKELERLREEAYKTGDMSKVHAYKRKKKQG